MRILAVSDYEEPLLYDYFRKERFPGIDLIISCGDLSSEYLSFLVTMFNVPLFYVMGNHDQSYAVKPPEGCVNLNESIVTFKGKKFLGIEGCMWYNGKELQYTDGQMNWKVTKLMPKIWLKKGVDVIITHAPPYKIHDAEDLCHTGFKSFRKLIDIAKPSFFLHGHMHKCYAYKLPRVTKHGITDIVNCYGYYIFDL